MSTTRPRRRLSALLAFTWLWYGVLGLAPLPTTGGQPWASGYLCARLPGAVEAPAPDSHPRSDCPLCIAGHCALAVPATVVAAFALPGAQTSPAVAASSFVPHPDGPPFHSRAPPRHLPVPA